MLSSTFHDGKLTSISVVDDNLVIEVSAQSKVTRIRLGELEKLRVTDFKEGNIINSLQVLRPKGGDVGRSLMKYVYEIDDADLACNTKLSSFLDGKLKEYEEGSILILEVEPSCGAYLVAVGRNMSEQDVSVSR